MTDNTDNKASKTINAENFNVNGSFYVGDEKKSSTPEPLKFVRVRLLSTLWKTNTNRPIFIGHRSSLLRDNYKQYHHIEWGSRQDPLFDVLTMNENDYPLIVLSVGIVLTEAEDASNYPLLNWSQIAASKRAKNENGNVADAFRIPMPYVYPTGLVIPRPTPLQKSTKELLPKATQIYSYVSSELDDAVTVAPQATYRFKILLDDFDILPNTIIFKMRVVTNKGAFDTEEMFMTTVPGRSFGTMSWST